MESMEERFRKGYTPLFKRNDDLLQNLFGEVEKSSHKTLILWSFLLIKEPVAYLTGRYSNSYILEKGVDIAWQWAQGNTTRSDAERVMKMIELAAEETDEKGEKCLFKAVNEAFLTIGDRSHAMGFAEYDLSSLVYEEGPIRGLGMIGSKIREYEEKLEAAKAEEKTNLGPWATFLSSERKSLA